MRHALTFLSLGCIVLAAAAGCDREGSPEEPERSGRDADHTSSLTVRVDENLLADQDQIVRQLKRQQERSQETLRPPAPAPAATAAPAAVPAAAAAPKPKATTTTTAPALPPGRPAP